MALCDGPDLLATPADGRQASTRKHRDAGCSRRGAFMGGDPSEVDHRVRGSRPLVAHCVIRTPMAEGQRT